MTPLKGKKVESLAEAQAVSGSLEEHWVRQKRIHGRTKRRYGDVRQEKPYPAGAAAGTSSATTSMAKRRLHLDGCVEVEAAYYVATAGLGSVGSQRAMDAMFVWRLLDPKTGEFYASNLKRQAGGHQAIRDADRPRSHATAVASTAGTCRTRQDAKHRRNLDTICSPGRTRNCVSQSRVFSNWQAIWNSAGFQTMPVRRRWSLRVPEYRFVRRYLSAARRLLSVCGKSIRSFAN